MKQRFHYTSVRSLLARENEEVNAKIYKLTLLMLGHYNDPPDDFDAEFESLKFGTSFEKEEEALVMFPSFSVMGDTVYPAFAIYRSADVRKLTNLYIPEYEQLDPRATSSLLSDHVWRELVDLSPNARARMIKKANVMPTPVLWDAISDPMGIQVNSVRSAAMVTAWTLRHSFARPLGYFPYLIAANEGKTSPIAAYEELSRYKALFVGHVIFTADKLLEEAGFLEVEDGGVNLDSE